MKTFTSSHKSHFFRVDSDILKETKISIKTLNKEVQNHFKSLRLREGENVKFSDGLGNWALYILNSDKELILVTQGQEPVPSKKVHLLLSSPKNDALFETLAHATQLGVFSIQLFRSEFSSVSQEQIKSKSLQSRCERILEAASLSCERNWNVKFNATASNLKQLVTDIKSSHEKYGLVLADENLSQTGKWGFTETSALKSFEDIFLLIGPEGGWSPAELEFIGKIPAIQKLALGPKVLKVPTATVTALALIQSQLL